MNWYNDDLFWELLYPFLTRDEMVQQAREQAGKIFDLVSIFGKSILDLCCGPGRFSVPLAEMGYQVTGVDRTSFYLEKAKEYALQKGVTIEWVQSDMREFVRPESYDLVLCMYTSFGYFDTAEEDGLVLNNMYNNLKPGGYCLIEVMGKETLARIFEPTTSEQLSEDMVMVVRHKVIKEWTRMNNDWIFLCDGKTHRFEIEHTIYSGLELKMALQQEGFIDIRLIGDYEGNEYSFESQRLIALGRRPFITD